MDGKALELILTHCKKLQKLVVDDEIWSTFFSLFEVSDKPGGISNGCLDCVGAIERLILCATLKLQLYFAIVMYCIFAIVVVFF